MGHHYGNTMVLLTGIRQRLDNWVRKILSKIGINIKVSPRMLARIDAEVVAQGYSSRAELINEAILAHLDADKRREIIREEVRKVLEEG